MGGERVVRRESGCSSSLCKQALFLKWLERTKTAPLTAAIDVT